MNRLKTSVLRYALAMLMTGAVLGFCTTRVHAQSSGPIATPQEDVEQHEEFNADHEDTADADIDNPNEEEMPDADEAGEANPQDTTEIARAESSATSGVDSDRIEDMQSDTDSDVASDVAAVHSPR